MKKIEIGEKIKRYWGYRDLKERGFEIKVYELKSKNKDVTELYNVKIINNKWNNDITAEFKIKKWYSESLGFLGYGVYENDYNITGELEYCDSLEDCINSIIYIFLTCY